MAFREQFRRADALLVVTPEYNFSIPGVLKNVFDWLSRPPEQTITNGKPVAIMGAGGRLGSARAQYHLRQVLGCLSMLPVPRPEVFVFNAWEKISADGMINDPAIEKQIGDLLAALAEWVACCGAARRHTDRVLRARPSNCWRCILADRCSRSFAGDRARPLAGPFVDRGVAGRDHRDDVLRPGSRGTRSVAPGSARR